MRTPRQRVEICDRMSLRTLPGLLLNGIHGHTIRPGQVRSVFLASSRAFRGPLDSRNSLAVPSFPRQKYKQNHATVSISTLG